MTDEGVAILRKLWAGPHVSHHGKHFHFDDVTITPRPKKKIDIWVGGRSEPALRRVARLGDGWFASFVTPQEFADGVAKIAEYARPTTAEMTTSKLAVLSFAMSIRMATRPDTTLRLFFRAIGGVRRKKCWQRSAVGTPAECREILQRYVDHGLTKFALWPACHPHQLLQQLAYYAQEIIPCFEQRDSR